MGFFEDVYSLVRKVPEGKVITYGQIAKILGHPEKSKVVGWALHQNPYQGDVPCHRVVNRFGQISGKFAFGGSESQRKLLEDEGIIFDSDGIINLKEYLWTP